LALCAFGKVVRFGVVEDNGELWHLRPDLVGYSAPLGAGGLRCLLHEGGGSDEGRDDAAAALARLEQAELVERARDRAHRPGRDLGVEGGVVSAWRVRAGPG
jgi:hypothetical protein